MKTVRIVVLAGVLAAGAIVAWFLLADDEQPLPARPPAGQPAETGPAATAAEPDREPPAESPGPTPKTTAPPADSSAKRNQALPTKVLSGILVDTNGNPLRALRVVAVEVGAPHNQTVVTTGGDGRFSCRGLMPGRHDLTIRTGWTAADHNGFIEVSAKVPRVGSFRGGVTDPTNRHAPFVLARFRRLEAGAEDVRLVVAPETALRFRVVAAGTGEPVADAYAEVDWGSGMAGTVAAVGGRFTVVCRDLFRFGVRVRTRQGNPAPSPHRVHQLRRGENSREVVVTLTTR